MNLPNLDNLKIFCDVAGQGSFSRGAKINGISQSAASQAVSYLEKRLGLRLLDRATRPSKLTPEGRTFYEGCRDLLERYQELEGRVRSSHEELECCLQVASIYSVVLYDTSRYVKRFTERFPHGSVRFQYLHPEDIYTHVLEGEVDLGLLSFPQPSEELRIIDWKAEPLVVVCAAGHPLAAEAAAGAIPLERLEGAEFVAFDEGLAIRREIDAFLSRRGVEVCMVSAFDNIEFIKRGVEVDGGISILPEPTVRTELASGALKTISIEGLDLKRQLSIISRRDRELSPALRFFIELMQADGAAPAHSPTADAERVGKG